MEDENKNKGGFEIDLVSLAKKIRKEKRIIIKNCIIATILGVLIVFNIPREYEVKVMLVPEVTKKNGISGSMGTFASIAGVNLGSLMNTEDAISPELYPKIVGSTPFLVSLFNVEVETKKHDLKTTLFDYLVEHQKSVWWGYVLAIPGKALRWGISLFKEEEAEGGSVNVDPFILTTDQAAVVKILDKRIITSVEKKTGVITIKVKMQDPLIAATVAATVKSRLQDHITTYRTNKSRRDLEFAEKLYNEAESEYYISQKEYATYADGNMNVVLAKYKTEEERLKNEMNLKYTVYNQVAQQLQLAKVKLQETIPVYTVIQPATVPLRPISANKIIILFLLAFFVCMSTITWIFLKEHFFSK